MSASTTRLHRVLERMDSPPPWAFMLVLGQSDDGLLYLPCTFRRHTTHHGDEPFFCRMFDPRNPRHWRYFAATWLTGWVVWLESS